MQPSWPARAQCTQTDTPNLRRPCSAVCAGWASSLHLVSLRRCVCTDQAGEDRLVRRPPCNHHCRWNACCHCRCHGFIMQAVPCQAYL
jgi:hypothetical protein